ncbi:MAG: hypothetical protein HY900_26540 [Deltaproteobacteria bacterium]|nr:hypothetical protein [Deltaproteobacteria bacterium]
MPTRSRFLLILGMLVCLGWAAVEALRVPWRGPRVGPWNAGPVDAETVRASFRPIQESMQAGRPEEALLALRERAQKGPYPGYAWFLLGEAAYEERAYAAAVQSYRKAVETDPSVGDRGAALRASWTIRGNLEVIQRSSWARANPPEIADLRYLQRRLLGGCE